MTEVYYTEYDFYGDKTPIVARAVQDFCDNIKTYTDTGTGYSKKAGKSEIYIGKSGYAFNITFTIDGEKRYLMLHNTDINKIQTAIQSHWNGTHLPVLFADFPFLKGE
jgi:hypothetical protein